ncbi:MAG: hypothetical protein PUP92_10010 [Rhizonema sp. PD38]|nr:hypothetical protein [Rhizonema sp. PD38]
MVCMEPEVANISLESLKECEVGGQPEDSCWIELPSGLKGSSSPTFAACRGFWVGKLVDK